MFKDLINVSDDYYYLNISTLSSYLNKDEIKEQKEKRLICKLKQL